MAADCEPFRQRACELLVCTATGTCDVRTDECCATDADCPDADPNDCDVATCEPNSGVCTGFTIENCCTVDADCSAGERCLEDSNECVPAEQQPCTVSYGFLKNNATAQQLLIDAFGGEDALALYLDGYALEDALELRPKRGDAYIILLKQWLTYAFNTLVGATSSGPVAAEPAVVFGPADERAREILSTSGVGQIAKRTSLRTETIELEALFAEFNEATVDAGTDLQTCYDRGLFVDDEDDDDDGFYAHLRVDDDAEREIIDAQVASLQYEPGFTDFAYQVDDASGLPTDRLTSAGIALVVSFSVVGFVLIQGVAVLAYRRFRAPQRRGYQRGASTDEFMLDHASADGEYDEIELESMGDARNAAPLSSMQDDALTGVAEEIQRGYRSA